MIILFISTNVHAGQVKEFIKEVQGVCPSVPALTIKKAMVELHEFPKTACVKQITLGIISRCYDLECATLKKMYQKVVGYSKAKPLSGKSKVAR